MLYALMIASANDAAVALANHVGGTRTAFVAKMNAKVQALGLRQTVFQSPHGLPPGRGQLPDISTARELAVLARASLQDPATLRYSSVRVRTLREQSASPFVMTNHNHLLGRLAGCDGLKTGYFSAAGSSIAVTAQRDGRRVIAVVLGTEGSKARDLKAMELVERGFAALAVAGRLGEAAPASARPVARGDLPTVRTEPAVVPVPEQASTPDEPLIKFNPPTPRRSP
jgi:serine-type D-Ala-D-Ala carboxypeptidase (penicillin-binding protein 5/6)